MLGELKDLQRELEAMIGRFEAIVTGPLPDEAAFAMMRMRMTRASSRKRLFLETQIYPRLILDDVDAETLHRFRREGQIQLQHSAEHIARWTMQRIMHDWEGYQRVSAVVRASMRQRQAEERRILYPLLDPARLAADAA